MTGTGDSTVESLPVLEDLGNVAGRSVLVRVDFNVPMLEDVITDDLRIRAAVPTLRWLQDQGASVTAITHLGRPRLAQNGSGTGTPVAADSCRFSVVPIRQRLAELVPGVELAENLRFHSGEIVCDDEFVAQLVKGHDVYVNDAFGVSHRAHASIVGPPRFLPSAAGRLLAREVDVLGRLRMSPRRPFVVVLGGIKVSDKLAMIESLLNVADSLVIGGGMCFTFIKAQGRSVGDSLYEDDMVERCRALLDNPVKIHTPVDIAALSPEGILGDPATGGIVRQSGTDLSDGWTGGDIGPASADMFSDVIHQAGTVLWNGPMGMFEDPRFSEGTKAVAIAMSKTQAFTVIGGGDSAAAVRKFGVDQYIDHVSTGGGAALKLIEKGDLPGLAALRASFGASRQG